MEASLLEELQRRCDKIAQLESALESERAKSQQMASRRMAHIAKVDDLKSRLAELQPQPQPPEGQGQGQGEGQGEEGRDGENKSGATGEEQPSYDQQMLPMLAKRGQALRAEAAEGREGLATMQGLQAQLDTLTSLVEELRDLAEVPEASSSSSVTDPASASSSSSFPSEALEKGQAAGEDVQENSNSSSLGGAMGGAGAFDTEQQYKDELVRLNKGTSVVTAAGVSLATLTLLAEKPWTEEALCQLQVAEQAFEWQAWSILRHWSGERDYLPTVLQNLLPASSGGAAHRSRNPNSSVASQAHESPPPPSVFTNMTASGLVNLSKVTLSLPPCSSLFLAS